MNWFKEAENVERKKILQMMREMNPTDKRYRELQSLLGGFEIIDEKRRQGRITQQDLLRHGCTILVAGAVITADAWIPIVGQKIKLGEFALRFLKL